MRVLVIGAGIHGLTTAISLADKGFDVTVIEQNSSVMSSTSGATHNRAHLGFHYPRSYDTAVECMRGLEFFSRKYNDVLIYPKDNYYLISDKSNMSFQRYLDFCDSIKVPYKIEMPAPGYIYDDHITGGIKVNEPIFDIKILTQALLKEIKEKNIKIVLNSEVIDFYASDHDYTIITTKCTYKTDFIVNATYASSNNILKILGLEEDMTEYYLQNTEVIVVKSPVPLPCMTIMDGKFFSIMEYANETPNMYLLYDVVNSVISKEIGYFYHRQKFESNFDKIIAHGSEYFPFFKDLEYVESWYGSRPIPLQITDDARTTRIKMHKKYPQIFSILEGKFISAPLIAARIARIILENSEIGWLK